MVFFFLFCAFRAPHPPPACHLLVLKCQSYFFFSVTFVDKGHPLSYSKASLGILISIKSKSPVKH